MGCRGRKVVSNSHHFYKKALKQKGNPGFVSRYMRIWRTSFMGALLFSGQLRLTFPMIHKKWKSFNYCEHKQRVKIGREGIICELLIRWTFAPSLPPSLSPSPPSSSPSLIRWTSGVLEWLCLSLSLARDHSFMETMRWPLDGEWVEGGKGEGGVSVQVMG